MLFNSSTFLIFFGMFLVLYLAVPKKSRWLLLLVASYVFYASWNVKFLGLIVLSTVVDYLVSNQLDRTDSPNLRKGLLGISLLVNLAVLFFFKYYNFFISNFIDLLSLFNISTSLTTLRIILPVGISFYTFQTMGYTIDVYRRRIAAERHLGRFALYVSFFPQLVAGPIERAENLIPQLHNNLEVSYDKARAGLRLIVWGYFLKMVVADNLALYVDQVYTNPTAFTGFPLILATVFFSFQIYGDFAGYSYIAIGVARVLGVDLMQNFRQPYFATSIQEFWQRWHISLSTWFRDYLYIPLGGSRVSFTRHLINLTIVFLVSGLWHGASKSFVVWGGIHAAFYVVATTINHFRRGEPRSSMVLTAANWLLVNVIVIAAWVFFRSGSVTTAWYIITHAFQIDPSTLSSSIYSTASAQWQGMLIIALLFAAEAIYQFVLKRDIDSLPRWVRWAGYVAVCLAIFNYASVSQVPFIYFQF